MIEATGGAPSPSETPRRAARSTEARTLTRRSHADPEPTPDRFLTIEDGPEQELKVKGSRFLGRGFQSADLEHASVHLESIRKRYHDATHHCWALRLRPPEKPVERSEDDGEPSGTAGLPILNTIRGHQVYDAMVVVTRYFGGTKLGTGGLVRAYAHAAELALDAVPKRVVWRLDTIGIRVEYPDVGAVEATLARAGEILHEVERAFEAHPNFFVKVRRSRTELLLAELREATAGRARCRLISDP